MVFVGYDLKCQIVDSITYHFPNVIPCTKVEYYVNNTLKGTNSSIKGNIKLTMTKFGVPYSASETVGFTKFITKEDLRIIPTGCKSEVNIIKNVTQTGSLNE